MLPEYSHVWKLITTALRLAEVSAAPTTAQIPDGSLALYAKAKAGNSNLYFKNDAGTEFDLGLTTAPVALTKTDDTNVTLTLGGSPTVALLAATSLTLGWTGTLGVARGGTNLASYAVGDLIYASGATTLAKLADVAAGAYLRSGGVTTAPLWSTLILPNAATVNRVVFASASNTYGESADVTYDGTDFGIGSGKRFRMQSQNRTRYLNSIVRVYQDTGTTVSVNDATITTITFDAEEIDTDGLHSTVSNTSRLTANLTGKYLVFGQLQWSISSGEVAIYIAVNGTTYALEDCRQLNETLSAGHNNISGSFVDLLTLTAGDYVEMQAWQSQVTPGALTFIVGTPANTHFGMYYVGE